MADEKKLSVSEVKKTIAASLAAAFGFVIALLWNQVVTGGLKAAGIDYQLEDFGWGDWAMYVVTAVILTVVMVLLIIIVGRWGSK